MQILYRKSSSNSKLNDILVCGDFSGKITLFELPEFKLLMEMNSHLKLVTCLSCNKNSTEIVTGSEDTFLNFWKLDENNDMSLKVSYRLADQIIMGVSHVRQDMDTIYVSCLDCYEFTVLKLNPAK